MDQVLERIGQASSKYCKEDTDLGLSNGILLKSLRRRSLVGGMIGGPLYSREIRSRAKMVELSRKPRVSFRASGAATTSAIHFHPKKGDCLATSGGKLLKSFRIDGYHFEDSSPTTLATFDNEVFTMNWHVGDQLLCGGGGGLLTLVDATCGSVIKSYGPVHNSRTVRWVASDGRHCFASGGRDAVVMLWDSRCGLRDTIANGSESIRCLAYEDEFSLYSVDNTPGVALWDLRRTLSTIRGSRQVWPVSEWATSRPVEGITVSSDRLHLFIQLQGSRACRDLSFCYRIPTNVFRSDELRERTRPQFLGENWTTPIALSSDNATIAGGCEERLVFVSMPGESCQTETFPLFEMDDTSRDIKTHTLHGPDGFSGDILRVAWSPDGPRQVLVAALPDGLKLMCFDRYSDADVSERYRSPESIEVTRLLCRRASRRERATERPLEKDEECPKPDVSGSPRLAALVDLPNLVRGLTGLALPASPRQLQRPTLLSSYFSPTPNKLQKLTAATPTKVVARTPATPSPATRRKLATAKRSLASPRAARRRLVAASPRRAPSLPLSGAASRQVLISEMFAPNVVPGNENIPPVSST